MLVVCAVNHVLYAMVVGGGVYLLNCDGRGSGSLSVS